MEQEREFLAALEAAKVWTIRDELLDMHFAGRCARADGPREVGSGAMAQHEGRDAVLELRVTELMQLFDSMDPAPFRKRDLDPRADEFIVGWAREQRSDAALRLTIRIEQGTPEDARRRPAGGVRVLREPRARDAAQLHQLLRNGRISLVIGLVFMAARARGQRSHGRSTATGSCARAS